MTKRSEIKSWTTQIRPPVRFQINGPSIIHVYETNNHGKTEINFIVEESTFVETIKLKKEFKNEQQLDQD